MYAEDTKILLRSKSLVDAECTISNELESIHKWFVSNKCTLNTSATKYIVFRSSYRAHNIIPIAMRTQNTAIDPVETISCLIFNCD